MEHEDLVKATIAAADGMKAVIDGAVKESYCSGFEGALSAVKKLQAEIPHISLAEVTKFLEDFVKDLRERPS